MHRKSIVIVMLHGVLDSRKEYSWKPRWDRHDIHQVEAALKIISKHYTFISMDQAYKILNNSAKAVKNPVVLTVDDGYLNFSDCLLPILQKLNIPSILFVPTGVIDARKQYWIDMLDYSLSYLQRERSSIEINHVQYSIDNNGANYRKICMALKEQYETDDRIEEFVYDIYKYIKQRYHPEHQFNDNNDGISGLLEWEDLRSLPSCVELGSHAVDHIRLDRYDYKVVYAQALESKRKIESETGRKCNYFCYPYGYYNDTVQSAVRNSGYHAAVTTNCGLNNTTTSEVYSLYRCSFPKYINPVRCLLAVSGILKKLNSLKDRMRFTHTN